MKDSFRIEIDMEQSMCSDCKKSSLEYYELLFQIRFKYYEDFYEIKKKCFDLITSTFSTINKFEELDNGFDFYFRTHSCMNKLTSMFHKNYLNIEKRSKKLIGRDNLVSKDKYRYFQSITLVNLKKGDRVRYKGENYNIKAINNNDLVLLNELNGDKKVITYEIIQDYVEKI